MPRKRYHRKRRKNENLEFLSNLDVGFSLDQTESDTFKRIDHKKWYFPDKPEGAIVKVKNHLDFENICSWQVSCTCIEFFCRKMCQHVLEIRNKYNNCVALLSMRTSVMINIKDLKDLEEDLRLDEHDEFNYSDIYLFNKNNPLKIEPHNAEYLWKGYEMNLAFHEFSNSTDKYRIFERSNPYEWDVVEVDEKKLGLNVYVVKSRSEMRCNCEEYVKCFICHICHHEYSCSCEYSGLEIPCRHGHAVAMYRDLNSSILHDEEIDPFHFHVNLKTRIRHNVGLNFLAFRTNDDERTVVDVSNPSEIKTFVVRIVENAKCSCKQSKKCYICRICIHMYTCMCKDYSNGFICTHLHAAHLFGDKNNSEMV